MRVENIFRSLLVHDPAVNLTGYFNADDMQLLGPGAVVLRKRKIYSYDIAN